MDAAIREADFVCILYDTNVLKTRDNVEAVWIPRIKKIREGLMVIPFSRIFLTFINQIDSIGCSRNQI